MKKDLKEFLEEVQTISYEIWQYGHTNKEHTLYAHKIEGLNCINIQIHSDDLDSMTGVDILECIHIAENHQETCFNTWYIDVIGTLIETKSGYHVKVQTPRLVINFYQKSKEESK